MKKNSIRLTEAQLHGVIKESVKRVLKEYMGNKYLMYDSTLDGYQADEIAEEQGCSQEEAAAMWFNETYYDMEQSLQQMPTHSQFIDKIDGGELYYDFGADYYFLVADETEGEMEMTM